MKCQNAVALIHDYLDHDIDEYEHHELFAHLKGCTDCKVHFDELLAAEQTIRQLPIKKPSPDFTKNVLKQIPQRRKDHRIIHWLKKHPITAAASIFLLLFAISLFSYVAPNDELKIVATNSEQLVVNGKDVIVPEGRRIKGDIVVENGNLEIKGEVEGNVTVVNGKILMANASSVDGNTHQVDQLLEKIWYHLKQLWYQF